MEPKSLRRDLSKFSGREMPINWTYISSILMVWKMGGAVNEERSLPIGGGKFHLGEKEFDENELCGISIQLDRNHRIAGYWQETIAIRDKVPNDDVTGDVREISSKEGKREENRRDTPSKQKSSPHTTIEKKTADFLYAADECAKGKIPEEDKKTLLKPILGNKWGQLQSAYKSVHPFGDERIYLSIEPKDFIVLQAPYQRLVNNSFLLHGYYNYRHLILGPDEEIGTGEEICFYLGVPGTYFEREKMVAVMFGFEGFECAGPVEVGKFGYYMRRVEL